MANAIFTPALEGFIAGEIDLNTAVIKAILVRGYTYDGTHKFVSDVTATGTTTGTAQTLGSVSITNGVFDAADITFSAVTANANNHAVLIYQASAVTGGSDVAASSQRVIGYYDTGTLLPVVPNGGDITVSWDNGTNKIFKIS